VIWVAVPVYNNHRTMRRVVEGVLEAGLPIVVVDDGSTDGSAEAVADLNVEVLTHARNQGKGAALMTAARHIQASGGTHMICFDADGQFEPRDIGAFITGIQDRPGTLFYGVRRFLSDASGSSVFGRKFSNFWARMTTGKKVRDSQCGFRAYPIDVLLGLSIKSTRYDFEVEAIVRASWAGVRLEGIPVEVTYSPPEGRVTHFRPLVDNARISRAFTRLVIRAMLPVPHKMVHQAEGTSTREVLSPWHPVVLFKALLTEGSKPWELAAAVGLGLFIATLPIFGLHGIAIIFLATLYRLNRLLAFSVSHLCAPPFVPAVCLLVGYRIRYKEWLSTFNAETLWNQLDARLFDYILGSLVVAPAIAVLGAALTFALAATVAVVMGKETDQAPPLKDVTAKYGSARGIGFFRFLISAIGLRGAYFFLIFPVTFYYLFRPGVRASVRPYVTRRFPQAGPLRSAFHGFRVVMEFSRTMVDQTAQMIKGPALFTLDVMRHKELKKILEGDRGVILLMTHAGNWKATISALEITDRPVNLLLYVETSVAVSVPGNAPRILGSAKIINVNGSFGGLIEATAALGNRETVSIMGDRAWGGRSVEVEFLGDCASVPESPYRLTQSTGARLLVVFVVRNGHRKFSVEFTELAYYGDEQLTKQQISAQLAQKYVECVEDFVARHPYSWFNFYDFWQKPEPAGGHADREERPDLRGGISSES